MLAITCPSVPTPTGLTLVPATRIVGITDNGAGTITLVVSCYSGHLHEVVTGHASGDRAQLPEPVPAAC